MPMCGRGGIHGRHPRLQIDHVATVCGDLLAGVQVHSGNMDGRVLGEGRGRRGPTTTQGQAGARQVLGCAAGACLDGADEPGPVMARLVPLPHEHGTSTRHAKPYGNADSVRTSPRVRACDRVGQLYACTLLHARQLHACVPGNPGVDEHRSGSTASRALGARVHKNQTNTRPRRRGRGRRTTSAPPPPPHVRCRTFVSS